MVLYINWYHLKCPVNFYAILNDLTMSKLLCRKSHGRIPIHELVIWCKNICNPESAIPIQDIWYQNHKTETWNQSKKCQHLIGQTERKSATNQSQASVLRLGSTLNLMIFGNYQISPEFSFS